MKKTKWTTKNFLQSFKCAMNGIKYVFSSQRNILIQVYIGIIAIVLGFLFKITEIEWLVLILTIAFVILSEFINTSIETTVDLITEEYNEKAKIAKDVSAGAVTLMAICSVIIGIIIYLPAIADFLRGL